MTTTPFALAIEDDGIGLRPDFSMQSSKSLGLRIVQILTKQLNGSLCVTSGKDNCGACFELIFPGV